jgi:hypothetical protein
LKSLFAQNVSDVTVIIVRSTTVVFHSHRFLVSGVGSHNDVAQHQYKSHGINTPETRKPMAVKNYSCAADDGCCDVRNMLSELTFQENCAFSWTKIKIFVTKMYGTTNIKN